MQRIYFHKVVKLDNLLKELLSISVDESIQYKLEVNGIRAVGSIVIFGEYDDGKQKNKFKESIDMALFANMDKIVDKREFYVKVQDFDYSIQNGSLKLVIQTLVHGVKDDEDKHIHVNEEQLLELKDNTLSHIESLLREEDIQMNSDDSLLEEVKRDNDSDFDEDDDIGTYYFYIVQPGDSYHTIATKYNVDEKIIRDYNSNKDVKEGYIVIIPYLP